MKLQILLLGEVRMPLPSKEKTATPRKRIFGRFCPKFVGIERREKRVYSIKKYKSLIINNKKVLRVYSLYTILI